MARHRRSGLSVAALCASAVMLVSACGNENGASGDGTAAGDPASGGVMDVIQISEPRTLDPVGLSNTWAHQPVVGNALYGTLMTNNVDTLDVEYEMATGFETDDGGQTFTLSLRPDLAFTDGTSLDAEAVKFNWERLADPANGSTAIRQASQIAGYEVIDPTTLSIALREPNPHFAQGILAGAMNSDCITYRPGPGTGRLR